MSPEAAEEIGAFSNLVNDLIKGQKQLGGLGRPDRFAPNAQELSRGIDALSQAWMLE